MRVAMREVQHRIRNAMRSTVGPYMAKPSSELRDRLIGSNFAFKFGRSQNGKIIIQRCGIKTQAHPVIDPLIRRLLARNTRAHPFATAHANPLRRSERKFLRRCYIASEYLVAQRHLKRLNRRRWPYYFACPIAVAMPGPFTCACFIFNIGPQHWLLHDAGINTLQPMVPPPLRFLQKSDGRTRHTIMRIDMRPRPHYAQTRYV